MPTIAYLCGTKGYRAYRPTDVGLPGSETAVIQLTRLWAKAGWQVTVFALTTPMDHDGVSWRESSTFDPLTHYDVVVLWRQAGFNMFNDFPQLSRSLLVMDFHDGAFDTEAFCKNPLSKRIDRLFVKSNFHRSLFKCIEDNNRFVIIPNGIRMEVFEQIRGIRREPHRFCFTSQYDRGLEPFLRFGWPFIRSEWPDAELHVYYGQAGKKENLDRINQLMIQPGVTDHGKVDLEIIAREKFRSTFHLYLCTSGAEIDCIAVRESLVAGCIPILTNNSVFKERYGIKIDGDPNEEETQERGAHAAVSLSYSEIALLRREALKSPTIIDWNYVASVWLDAFSRR